MDNQIWVHVLTMAGNLFIAGLLFGAIAWTMAWVNHLVKFHAQITIGEKTDMPPQYVWMPALLWAAVFFLSILL
jgi:hypothetical protein